MSGNTYNLELVFLVGSTTLIGCVLFVVAISRGRSCPTAWLRWRKMHVCSSRNHHNKCIDHICALNHVIMHMRQCASMCCHPTNPRSSTSSGIACCVFAPFCCCIHHIKCSTISRQHAMRKWPLHMNPNFFVELANKTWKTLFIRYKDTITNLLPSVPTYTARHPQSMLRGLGSTQTDDPNTWSYHWLVFSLVESLFCVDWWYWKWKTHT